MSHRLGMEGTMDNELAKIKKDCFLKALAAIGFILFFVVAREKLNPPAFALVLFFSIKWGIDFIITFIKYNRIKKRYCE